MYFAEIASNVSRNGAPPSVRDALEQKLIGDPLTQGYTPALPLWAMYSDASYLPQIYILRDIELMLTHPMVQAPLEYFKGGLYGIEEMETEANSPEVKDFVDDHINRFWQMGMPRVQSGYEWGWVGLEPLYTHRDNYLKWDALLDFHPRDTFLLEQNHKAVGIRIKNVPDKGEVDLWLGTDHVPAKGIWYAHNPRYQQYYGRSQILAAWRPWRRLAWKDAAETVADTGVYRFAYCGPIIGYPEEDLQIAALPGGMPAGTTMDASGNPRRYARDIARFIAEQLKAGAGVGFPSTCYPQEQGGGKPKWTFEMPKSTLNVDALINYIKYLQDQISYGCGVPPELLEASETGSGYSGRKLPMEAFMMGQQKVGNVILKLFVEQILRPLVFWNFGAGATFTAKLPNILKMSRQAASGAATSEQGQGGGMNESRPDQVPGPVSPQGAPTPPQTMAGPALSLFNERVRRIADIIRRTA